MHPLDDILNLDDYQGNVVLQSGATLPHESIAGNRSTMFAGKDKPTEFKRQLTGSEFSFSIKDNG
jgi:hypothetical protein